jgi:hypothetical protein
MVGPAGGKARMDFYTAAKSCGLTTNLKQVLDAGDSRSYPGTGGKWLDMTSGGYDMFLGTTASAQSSDPTFHGTVGKHTDAEYFSVDGGDYFTYDTTQETWMKALAKSGPNTIVLLAYYGAITLQSFGNDGNTASERGMHLQPNSGKWTIAYTGTDGVVYREGFGGPDLPDPPSGPHFLGFSYDMSISGAGTIQINEATGSDVFGIAAHASDPTNTLRLGAKGDLTIIAGAGNRYYGSWIWQGTQLDGSAMLALFNTIRGRYNK